MAIAIDAREANEASPRRRTLRGIVAEEWAGSGSGPGWASRLRRAGAAEAFRGADSDDERWRRARDAVLAALDRDEGGGEGGVSFGRHVIWKFQKIEKISHAS